MADAAAVGPARARHLFLDLEDTVITPTAEGWHQSELIWGKLEPIQAFIHAWRPEQVHLFSFALHTLDDLVSFNKWIRPRLENALGMPLVWTPLTDTDILPACCSVKGLRARTVDFSDMSAFWSKQDAFRLFVQHWSAKKGHPGIDAVLFDDMVLDESFEFPALALRGRLFNIDMFDPRQLPDSGCGSVAG